MSDSFLKGKVFQVLRNLKKSSTFAANLCADMGFGTFVSMFVL